ncbi:MAG: adenylate/guanylate cyclase domain-containing protein [Gammaproteobacteria bacterium]|nr:adenylate/guanylate cyclase domain-containing protein [Gammaproteobacteria bacterium]
MLNLLQNRWLGASLIMVAAGLLLTALHLGGALQRLEWLSYDLRMHATRDAMAKPTEVAVILIDEASLKAMEPVVGRWPWPRSVHADILDFINSGQPRAVLFDILFSERESTPGQPLGDTLSANDQRLAAASGDGPVIHALQIYADHQDEINHSLLDHTLPGPLSAMALTTQRLSSEFGISLTQHNNVYYAPFEACYNAASGLGVVNVDPDADGIHRRMRLLQTYQDRAFPSLGLAPLIYRDRIADPALLRNYQTSLRAMSNDGNILINYYDTIETYSMSGVIASAQQVMSGDVEHLLIDPAEFKDKIIFIGASGAGLEDLKATPLSATTPGVYLHAATAANLLHGEILHEWPRSYSIIITIVLGMLTLAAILLQRRIALQLALTTLIAISFVAINLWAFRQQQVIDLALPLASIISIASLSFLYLLFTEGRDRRRVRAMLGQYVSPAVLNTVLEHYQYQLEAEVGSEECLTILFSDIRGFTNLSETQSPAKVVEMLNHYFSSMTDAIFNHDGTIDKFIGDAIMAFWGAPIRDGQHAIKGVRAAIEMHQRLAEVNRWLTDKGYTTIDIGVGLNTGPVILGNIGSSRKLDYTIIGDNVNLASRLEGLTKPYGCPIIISEYTYDQLRGEVACYAVDLVRVKGKQHPIKIYAPIINTGVAQASQLATISEAAFLHYLAREWQLAIAAYQQLPNSEFQKNFIGRCHDYEQSPPPPEWDGVYTMTTK